MTGLFLMYALFVAVLALALAFGTGAVTVDDLTSGSLFPQDTDGDRLNDDLENGTVLSGQWYDASASYDRKDIYVVVVVGENQQPLTGKEVSGLKEIFAGMPVTNPDGSTGVDLHIHQRESDLSITFDDDREQLEELYTRYLSSQEQCRAHMVILGDVPQENSIGYGAAPGYASIVNGGDTDTYRTQYTVRTTTIIHELLHNVVGQFETGTSHTDEGWLAGATQEHGTQFFMSEATAHWMNETGFAESEYYEQEVCTG